MSLKGCKCWCYNHCYKKTTFFVFYIKQYVWDGIRWLLHFNDWLIYQIEKKSLQQCHNLSCHLFNLVDYGHSLILLFVQMLLLYCTQSLILKIIGRSYLFMEKKQVFTQTEKALKRYTYADATNFLPDVWCKYVLKACSWWCHHPLPCPFW